MTASPVVDLDTWRERARVVRSSESTARAAAAPAGPVSVFGPVMAFGLVRRPAPAGGAALPRAVHAPHLDAGGPEGPEAARRTAPVGPPQLRVLPSLSTQPGVTSAPAPRLRAVPDTRGTSRGPRR